MPNDDNDITRADLRYTINTLIGAAALVVGIAAIPYATRAVFGRDWLN